MARNEPLLDRRPHQVEWWRGTSHCSTAPWMLRNSGLSGGQAVSRRAGRVGGVGAKVTARQPYLAEKHRACEASRGEAKNVRRGGEMPWKTEAEARGERWEAYASNGGCGTRRGSPGGVKKSGAVPIQRCGGKRTWKCQSEPHPRTPEQRINVRRSGEQLRREETREETHGVHKRVVEDETTHYERRRTRWAMALNYACALLDAPGISSRFLQRSPGYVP